MATASQKNGLSHVTNAPQGSSINTYASTADVVGFPSRAELTAFLTSTGFGRTGAAVVFNDTVASNILLPNDIQYEVQYNQTAVGSWMSRAGKDPLFAATSISSFTLNIQRAIHEAVLAVRASSVHGGSPTSSPGFEFRTRKFPVLQTSSTKQTSRAPLESFAPLFYYCAMMMTFLVGLNMVVAEKERKLLSALRTVGLY